MSSVVTAPAADETTWDGLAGLEVFRPGGPALSAELLHAAAVGQPSRVVQLLPNFGETTKAVTALNPREMVAIAPTAIAAKAMGRIAPEVHVTVASPAATGLPERSATVVLGEGVLTPAGAAAGSVVAEAARLLRSGGRAAFHEICISPGAPAGEAAQAVAELAEVGLHPRDPAAWRALIVESDLIPVGLVQAPLVHRGKGEIVSERGMKAVLATFEVAGRDRRLLQRAIKAQSVVRHWREILGGIVVVGEKPLIAGMRRPA